MFIYLNNINPYIENVKVYLNYFNTIKIHPANRDYDRGSEYIW